MPMNELPELSHDALAISDILARLSRIEGILADQTLHYSNWSTEASIAINPKDTVVSSGDTPTEIAWPAKRVRPQDSPTDRIPLSSLMLDDAIHDLPIRVLPPETKIETKESLAPASTEISSIDWIAAIPEPLVVLDIEGNATVWSRAAEDWLGWTKEDVQGHSPQFLAAEGIMSFHRMITQVRNGIRVRGAYLPLVSSLGHPLHASVSASLDSTGHVVLLLRPMAGPESKSDRLTDLAEPTSTQPRLEIVGKMMAGLVHDFNNVLAAVSGSAQIILESAPAGTIRESAEVIQSATRFATDLTQRVMHLLTEPATELKPLDLGQVLVELEKLIRVVASGVKCVITPGAGVPAILADRTEIEQLILNLVANARDAMPRGGVLGIRTSVAEVRVSREGWPIHLSPGSYVCLAVIDTGKGIDRKTREKMFDMFFSTKQSGSGIGLSIIKDVIDRAGGHLEIDSVVDRGSVFRVFLPIAPEASLTPEIGRTVLLVDDDESVREVAKAALERIGFSVLEAVSGDEAWRLAKAMPRSIDLLVTDVVLPGLNGRKLAERVRSTRPSLPVVFMSGYVQTDQETQRGTSFVAKPFRAKELLHAIRKARAQIG